MLDIVCNPLKKDPGKKIHTPNHSWEGPAWLGLYLPMHPSLMTLCDPSEPFCPLLCF
jgi:hypothetical protein